jgi:hypothetical protein
MEAEAAAARLDDFPRLTDPDLDPLPEQGCLTRYHMPS